MEQRVKQILENWLQNDPDGAVDLYALPNGRIAGHVISHRFDNLDHADRQTNLRQALRDGLGPEFQNVSVILTYTPHEMRVMQAA